MLLFVLIVKVSWTFRLVTIGDCVHDNWILTSVAEVHGVWNLAITYVSWHLFPVFSTDQLSPAGTDSSQTCARLCRRDFVLHYIMNPTVVHKK